MKEVKREYKINPCGLVWCSSPCCGGTDGEGVFVEGKGYVCISTRAPREGGGFIRYGTPVQLGIRCLFHSEDNSKKG